MSEKTSEPLALHGGSPVRTEPLPLEFPGRVETLQLEQIIPL